MQISAANLIAAQQAAQAALAAKQAARAATAPAFAAALSDFKAEPIKAATEAATAAPAQGARPQAGVRLGQHVDITV